MNLSESRSHRTFLTEGLPSPRVDNALCPSESPGSPDKAARSSLTEINRWFCCRCACSGYRDPVGIGIHPPMPPISDHIRERERDDDYNFEFPFHDQDLFPFTAGRRHGTTSPTAADTPASTSRHSAPPSGITTAPTAVAQAAVCFRLECTHTRCHNCLLGPSHDVARASRTVGGLHTSPVFLDPVYWLCACGEWARNIVGVMTAMGAMCANPVGCPDRWRGVGGGLVGGSLVLNRFGQRLGTADQRVAVKGGPWWWQRRGLGREECVLIREFREGGLRGEGVKEDRFGRHPPPPPPPPPGEFRVWREGEPCPRYPVRRPPRGMMPSALEEYDAEYEREYLRGIPAVPPSVGDAGSSLAGERGYRTDMRGGVSHGWGSLRM